MLICHVLFSAKTDEMRKEIETLNQTFERIVDRKDALIKSLMKDIDESDRQYHRALQSHLENVNNLVQFQLSRLQEMEDKLQEELHVLREMFDKERLVVTLHLDTCVCPLMLSILKNLSKLPSTFCEYVCAYINFLSGAKCLGNVM